MQTDNQVTKQTVLKFFSKLPTKSEVHPKLKEFYHRNRTEYTSTPSLSNIELSMTSGSHGGEYEDGCLLGCSAMWTGMNSAMLPTIRALMMEAVETFETLVNSYQSTQRYNPEHSHFLMINVFLFYTMRE
jgi:hypothetical protein